jgi:RNA polymerase sigma-70 factor (ECF subfamily)
MNQSRLSVIAARSTDAPAVTDVELYNRVLAGEPEAMNELLRRYWGGVVEYGSRFSPSRDSAEDIAQEAFILVWRGKACWSARGSMKSFLYGVARRLARNRARRWREVSVGDGVETAAFVSPWTPAAHFDEAELRRRFIESVARLPAKRQEVFNLARVHGLSYREIAEIMEISPQTVANQMSAALAFLRRELRDVLDT